MVAARNLISVRTLYNHTLGSESWPGGWLVQSSEIGVSRRTAGGDQADFISQYIYLETLEYRIYKRTSQSVSSLSETLTFSQDLGCKVV